MEKKFKITKERFIDWYFSDINVDVIDELKKFGEVTITAQGLFDSCGYIPLWLCEGQEDKEYNGISPLALELSPSDVELI
jgi:hypothetical protein